jgi:virginiamycin B lyase
MLRRLALLATFALAGCGTAAAALPSGGISTPAKAHQDALKQRRPAIAEFAISPATVPNPIPYQIVAGSDGAMWFTEEAAGAVGRIDSRGHVRQIQLPSRNAQPEGIALGPHGALFVAENEGPNQYATHVARIANDGSVREWSDSDYMPQGVAAGSDGRMWFTQSCGGLAVLLLPGNVTQRPLQGIPSQTNAIVEGPDAAMWFAEDGTATIGRMTSSGAVTLYRGFIFDRKYSDVAHGVAVGPDGNLWWTALASGVIWAMDVHGTVVHRYTIPTKSSQPWGITAGPDGALWFTESGPGKIGRVTTEGAFSEYAIPTPNAKPQGLAFGPNGKLWFAESGANRIGVLTIR